MVTTHYKLKNVILVHTVQLKAMIKAHSSGMMYSLLRYTLKKTV